MTALNNNIIRNCPICLDPIKKNDFGDNTPDFTICGHSYHRICLSTWLKDHNTCPECRKVQYTFRKRFICPYVLNSIIYGSPIPQHYHNIYNVGQDVFRDYLTILTQNLAGLVTPSYYSIFYT